MTFPNDAGAVAFVPKFRVTVVPDTRDRLSIRPPLLILRVPGDAGAYPGNVNRVLDSLTQSLHHGGKLVPYTVVEQVDGPDTLLSVAAGKDIVFNIPRNMIPERLPNFAVLRDVVTYIRNDPAPHSATQLRDHAYQERIKRGKVLGALWSAAGGEGPPPPGFWGWLFSKVGMGAVKTIPRWFWRRRKTARLIRRRRFLFGGRQARWLGAELAVAGGKDDLFEVMEAQAALLVPGLGAPGTPAYELSLQVLEDLLVHALLEDLKTPRVGGILPKRRRRTARSVLLIRLSNADGGESPAAERFLRAYRKASDATEGPGPLVIAVGRPSAALVGDLALLPCSLSQAATSLDQGGVDPLLVDLDAGPFADPGLAITTVKPRTFKLGWRTSTAVVALIGVLGAGVLGFWACKALPGPPGKACVGGSEAVAAPYKPELKPQQWYEEAVAEIKKENERAVRYAQQGRPVRTVVHFGSDRPLDTTDVLFDGAIPELRGIGMWQRRLNDEAASNDSLVPLIVDVRPTGPAFRDAEKEARRLVEEIKRAEGGTGPTLKAHEQIVGVLGFAQSKDVTSKALRILEEAEIPVVGTTATADEMLGSGTYWPSTPLNSTEARIAADFVTGSNIIGTGAGSDTCTPARAAVLIQSSADLYSKSLADKFAAEFPGVEDRIDFSQDGTFGEDAPGIRKMSTPIDVADAVCDQVGEDKETVVYWTARARDFTAFVNALEAQATCTQGGLTVVGGNELTNVALTGQYHDKTWLRLYHSAHRLPAADPRASDQTTKFATDYDTFVKGDAKDDPWRDDGHSAVSYDAFQVLSRAINGATSGQGNIQRSAVLSVLRIGVTFNGGATGSIQKPASPNRPPEDKTLVILKQTAGGPVAVVACGAFRQGETSKKQGAPCSR